MAIRVDVLGRGWAFPFRFTSRGRIQRQVGVAPAESAELINMSIRQILGTRIGSRVIDRDFGSDLRDTIFEPIDNLTATAVQMAITGALRTWERRIEVLSVTISLDRVKDGILDAQIFYRIISSQQVGNLVYPLYLTPEMRVRGQINVGAA